MTLSDNASVRHHAPSSVLENDKVGGHSDTVAVIAHDNPLDQSPFDHRGEIVVILAGYASEHKGSNWCDQRPLSDPTQATAAWNNSILYSVIESVYQTLIIWLGIQLRQRYIRIKDRTANIFGNIFGLALA